MTAFPIRPDHICSQGCDTLRHLEPHPDAKVTFHVCRSAGSFSSAPIYGERSPAALMSYYTKDLRHFGSAKAKILHRRVQERL